MLRTVASLALWLGPGGPEAQAEAHQMGAHPDGGAGLRSRGPGLPHVIGGGAGVGEEGRVLLGILAPRGRGAAGEMASLMLADESPYLEIPGGK